MNISLAPGTYVVAVSGGVDSMTLLHLLNKQPNLKLVVAHFDHGIREDSNQDRLLVQRTAKKYNLPFSFDKGNLGPVASEDVARKARYEFLRKLQDSIGAKAVVTAHHRDDVLETAIINHMRGSGRRGLASLRSKHGTLRPLLKYSKKDIKDYALKHKIAWREDSTNSDDRYLRNRVRQTVRQKFSPAQRDDLITQITALQELNDSIDNLLSNHLHTQSKAGQIDRQWFIMLPHNVASELLVHWLRENKVANINSRGVDRLLVAAKTRSPGKSIDVDYQYVMKVGKGTLALVPIER